MTTELTKAQLKILKNMTEDNCHGEAYLLASCLLGLNDLAEQFARINRQHELDGYLDVTDSHKRYSLYINLLAETRKLMSETEYKKFYQCF